MNCAKCGAIIPDGAVVCPTCGAPVQAEPADAGADQTVLLDTTVPPAQTYDEAATQYVAPEAAPQAEEPPTVAAQPAFQQVTYIPDKSIYQPTQPIYSPGSTGYYTQPARTAPMPYDVTQPAYAQSETDAAASADSYQGNADEQATPAADAGTQPVYDAGQAYGAYDANQSYAAYGGAYNANQSYAAYGSAYDANQSYAAYGYDQNQAYAAYYQQAPEGKKKKKKERDPNAPKLKWYKFLIYFHLFFFAFTHVVFSLFMFLGGFPKVVSSVIERLRGMPEFATDGELLNSLEEIFNEIFAPMKTVFLIMAIVALLSAVFAIVLRFMLAKKAKAAPTMYFAFCILRLVVKLGLDAYAFSLFIKGFTALIDEFPYAGIANAAPWLIMLPSALLTLIIMLLSIPYFKKRKNLFSKEAAADAAPAVPAEEQTIPANAAAEFTTPAEPAAPVDLSAPVDPASPADPTVPADYAAPADYTVPLDYTAPEEPATEYAAPLDFTPTVALPDMGDEPVTIPVPGNDETNL